MKFTINRSEWLRGEGADNSRLLRAEDGKRCCVGQMCRQLGVPDDELREKKAVGGIVGSLQDDIQNRIRAIFMNGRLTRQWVGLAYEENDDPAIADDVREWELKKLAAEAGHELEFVD